jgi:chromosome partitioning protein
MRRIAIINQKGGVGKTTTAVNLGAALARSGQRVCILDLDPQAHATSHLGIEPDGELPSVYDMLVHARPLADVRREVGDGLWLVGSDINLAAAEVELAGVVGREVILRDLLEPEDDNFDFMLMDCAPSLGVLTLNALAAATEVFIPLQPHFLALHGLGKLLETTALVAKRINPGLRVTGIILCLYEANARLTHEVVKDLQAYLDRGRSAGTPWSQAQIFATPIRRNIKLAECPSHGQSIFSYAPGCHGAADYAALAAEVLGKPQVSTARPAAACGLAS